MGKKGTKGVDILAKDNLILKDDKSIVDAFNHYFASTMKVLSESQTLPPCSLPLVDSKFQFSTISEEDVLHILSHLNTSKSTGPDGI